MAYADISEQIDLLTEAAHICEQHVITENPQPYPRWPDAWSACEIVWRAYLDMKTVKSQKDLDDIDAINREADRLLRALRRAQ